MNYNVVCDLAGHRQSVQRDVQSSNRPVVVFNKRHYIMIQMIILLCLACESILSSYSSR